jgi:hypothetical protein
MFYYYLMLILGLIFVIAAVFTFIAMYVNKYYPLLKIGKSLGLFLMGVLLLAITFPSLKYVVFKEYDIVSGNCVIEIDSSSRSSSADFKMLNTREIFTFNDIS